MIFMIIYFFINITLRMCSTNSQRQVSTCGRIGNRRAKLCGITYNCRSMVLLIIIRLCTSRAFFRSKHRQCDSCDARDEDTFPIMRENIVLTEGGRARAGEGGKKGEEGNWRRGKVRESERGRERERKSRGGGKIESPHDRR